MDLGDVRALEPARHAGFPHEAGDRLQIGRAVTTKDLQGAPVPGEGVLDLEDLAERTLPDAAPALAWPRPTLAGLRVLLVEDDAGVREIAAAESTPPASAPAESLPSAKARGPATPKPTPVAVNGSEIVTVESPAQPYPPLKPI